MLGDRPRAAARATALRLAVPLALALTIAISSFGPLAAEAADDPAVRGRVKLSIPGVSMTDVGPVVAYLERLDGDPSAGRPPAPASIVQVGANFDPGFLVIERGQPVEMPNADAIYHNVFSFSKPNDFDLGLYPAGESRTIQLDHAGVVKIYCSIHESMSGTIFVAPEPHFSVVGASGRFTIEGVPPGRYRLSVWCERLPTLSMEIEVGAAGTDYSELEWSLQAD